MTNPNMHIVMLMAELEETDFTKIKTDRKSVS